MGYGDDDDYQHLVLDPVNDSVIPYTYAMDPPKLGLERFVAGRARVVRETKDCRMDAPSQIHRKACHFLLCRRQDLKAVFHFKPSRSCTVS